MVIKASRSKPVSYLCLALFFLMLVNTSYLNGTIEQSGRAELVFREGVELYKIGEYIKAIEKFSRVLILTKNQVLLADNYFYLSLCNYYLGEKESAREWIKKMIEIEPGREISPIYPADYVTLFNQAKREAATVQLDQERRTRPVATAQPPREQPREAPAVYYRESERKGGGGKALLYILGGALIAGGVAYFLLQKKDENGGTTDPTTGSIQVSSTPTGAAIYLDGSNTGMTTNSTLTDKTPGSHTIKLTKEGYEDYEMSVTVTAGQTVSVSATLTAHTIAITSPDSSTAWVRGEQAEVQWTSNAVVSAVGNNLLQRRLNRILNVGGSFSNLNRMRLMQARSFLRTGVRTGRTGTTSGSEEAGETRGIRTQSLNTGSYSRTGGDTSAQISEPASDSGQNAAALQGIPGRFAAPYQSSVQGLVEPLAMPNVKIELFRGSSVVKTIAENTANDGSHKWNVPAPITIANNYKVRISCAADASVYEDSEVFGITDFGTLVIKSTPTGAKIYIDGVDSGKKTNRTLNKVATGNRTIKLVKEGYDDWEDTAKVEAGKTTNVNATLDILKFVIISPKDTTVWDKGNQATITWQTAKAAPPAEGQEDLTAALSGSQTNRQTQNNNRGRPGQALQRGRTGFSAPDGRVLRNRKTPGLSADTSAGNWRVVSAEEIKDRGITDVKIELYKGAAKVATIVNKISNNGSYAWDVPDGVDWGGNNYWVKLTCVNKPAIKTEGKEFVITDMSYQFDLTWDSSGGGNGQFSHPYGIAHSQEQPRGIFVTDGWNHRIQKFKDDGTYVIKWGSNGSANNQYKYPVGVAVHYYGSQQYVYVADWGNHRVQKTSKTGGWICKWGSNGSLAGQFKYPADIAVDKTGLVYVVDNDNDRIQKFNSFGTYQGQWGSTGSGPSQFNEPYGIAIDHIGNLYVADANNHRVQKFNTAGLYKTQWGSIGSGEGQFGKPYGIEVDRWGFVYVTDYQYNRIQKFTSEGVFLLELGTSGAGTLNNPWGICVDGYGRIYVVDEGNNRVVKFNTD